MEAAHNGDDLSYFPSQRVIQPVRTGDSLPSSSSSLSSSRRRTRNRVPTPPFPSTTPIPSSGQDHPNTANETHPTKNHIKSKSERQAYARILTRLQDEAHEDNAPHSRSRSNSSGSTALPAILRLLAHETARADSAERALANDSNILLSRMRDTIAAKQKSEAELAQVTTELGLYKLQLEVARREINRAQSIVDELERARVEAEDRGIRDRDRMRKMMMQRAVEIAREEGRQEGWRQGLERGRWVDKKSDGRQYRAQSPSRSPPSTRSFSRASSRMMTRENTHERSGTRRSGKTEGTATNDGPLANVPMVVSPMPRRISSQPQGLMRTPSQSPENISIHPNPQRRSRPRTPSPPQPPRSETRSPSLAPSRRSRSVILPPDGYIPTLGPDSLIALPPPHELSQPVEFGAPPVLAQSNPSGITLSRNATEKENRMDNTNSQRDKDDSLAGLRIRDYAPGQASSSSIPDYDDVFRDHRRAGRDTPAMSTASRGSTHISQYDLVSPPSISERGKVRNARNSHQRDDRDVDRMRPRTQPERMVEEWRSANSDIVDTPTPAQGSLPGRRTASAAGGSIYAMAGRTSNSIETSFRGSGNPTSPRIRSPRVSGGPREPKENNSPTAMFTPSAQHSNIYRDERTGDPPRYSSITEPRPMYPARPSTVSSLYYQAPRLNSSADQESHSTVRNVVQRSISGVTVPGILVEPPSRSPTSASEGTVVDPILLTPEDAHRTTPLPLSDPLQVQSSGDGGGGQDPVIVLPTNALPPGFVPLSPIPAQSNVRQDDYTHRQMYEQYGPSGYQIYVGRALVPDEWRNQPVRSSIADPTLDSILFGEPERPSTAADISSGADAADYTRRRVHSFGSSPAPLDRPLSIFSDSDS
ncbi:hypothetical protein Hypma_005691 [Hypsizygus marmoreus]|uniref:Uncharacterized protein n=1 Tax=Hypsizygus marmoreus TaxID=39966 RepID=A0A369K6S0_HYPMA|nr:hypothetical protein Hypma_005691 [Hypsizygus marmoreus]